jgi:dipeptidyl aminopeptidase/acylaminoacyl peptidase
LPIPPTPLKSTNYPVLDPIYRTPVPLTHAGSASGIQIIPNDQLIFSLSSLTSPIDVYILRGLRSLQDEILHGNYTSSSSGKADRITGFTEAQLKGKNLSKGEDFWFKGAENRDVHGWVLKPRGWGTSQTKWPIVLLIHGGNFIQLVNWRSLFIVYTRSTKRLGRWMVKSMESKWSVGQE